MPNGSVSDRLKCKTGTQPLTWKQRSNIAVGTARGLVHLHALKPPIIHGDIKVRVNLQNEFGACMGGTTCIYRVGRKSGTWFRELAPSGQRESGLRRRDSRNLEPLGPTLFLNSLLKEDLTVVDFELDSNSNTYTELKRYFRAATSSSTGTSSQK